MKTLPASVRKKAANIRLLLLDVDGVLTDGRIMDYVWCFSAPGETLRVHMENFRGGKRVFDATLELKR